MLCTQHTLDVFKSPETCSLETLSLASNKIPPPREFTSLDIGACIYTRTHQREIDKGGKSELSLSFALECRHVFSSSYILQPSTGENAAARGEATSRLCICYIHAHVLARVVRVSRQEARLTAALLVTHARRAKLICGNCCAVYIYVCEG